MERALGADGRLDRIFEMTQPLFVLPCGVEAREGYERWRTMTSVQHDPHAVLAADHPSIWMNNHGKPGMGPVVTNRLATALREVL